jgi:hypothetical protein
LEAKQASDNTRSQRETEVESRRRIVKIIRG